MSALRQAQGALLPVATGRRTGRILGRQVIKYKGLAFGALVLTALASAMGVAVPILLGRMVDLVAASRPPVTSGMIGSLAILVGLLVLAAAVGSVLMANSARLCEQLGVTIAADLREQTLDRSLTMDADRLERASAADVTSRVTADVEAINASVQLAAGVFLSLVTVILTAVGFAWIDWRLALAFLAVFPVYVLSLRWYLPRSSKLYAAERQSIAQRTRSVLSSLQGTPTVHAYAMEASHTAGIEKTSRLAIGATMRALRAFLLFAITMNLAEAIGLSSLMVAGFLLVRADLVTIGAVTAAALMFHRLFGPLGSLLMSFDEVQSAGAALARLVGIADLDPPRLRPKREVPAAAGVIAKGVTHEYVEGRPVLRGVDISLRAGENLAIVGESGAGKTTLAAVVGGVFPASIGQIMIGTDSLDDLDPLQLRRRVGVVTQEVHIFAGTLRDDLRLALPSASDDQLLDALAVVGADRWLVALPDGLDTVVGEHEHQLTAAQAQQVALARIVLANPPVVILDEATAEAGSAGARELEASARAVIAGRTAIVVAHRLTQARECDQIAVMDNGEITELGSHDELVARDGRYAALWRAWSK